MSVPLLSPVSERVGEVAGGLVAGTRRRLGDALFSRVAGPEGPRQRARIHGAPGPRRFGPGDPIARVHGDASMFVGGMRALMLQALHPAAMAGVAEHSAYREDMWGRLHRTATFIAATTFATDADADAAVAAVRRIHERIVGTMRDGTPYAASDPHLLRWVHVAEIDSFLTAHQVYGARPLDDAEADTYVAQAAHVAEALGARDVPHTRAELDATLQAYRPELRGTPEAREAVRALLVEPPLPLAARVPYATLAAAAVGLMPAWTRLPLRLPWLPVTERTAVRAVGRVATGTIRWAMATDRAEAERLRTGATSG
ncbi:oxygenase MpaB family protein [Nocardioides zeae]|uniref:Oxygenase MpaB family protein n=1 Tax=Nocardioides imazamoxiresistens TaxID=3231893 RepID=A0ABU3PY93_9ACTN|nr:oxygenase MpaB family protein [Nocardioides zeae]MDT9594205.1 oxygenase MpaB family protein [Nocardioides zeae]